MNTYTRIATEKTGRVLRLTLNRPDVLNAVDETLHRELAAVFVDVNHEPGVDAIILTGAGRAFCAGGDTGWLQRLAGDFDAIDSIIRDARALLFNLLQVEAPIVAAVNGDAVGLGASLVLGCDIAVAKDSARIGDPHVRMGLVAGDGGALLWPRQVGPLIAKEYLLTGRLISAPDAERIGLINQSAPEAEFDSAVQKKVDALLAMPPRAVRGTKRAVNASLLAEAASVFQQSLSLEAETMLSADYREAVSAFIEKRKPAFTGR